MTIVLYCSLDWTGARQGGSEVIQALTQSAKRKARVESTDHNTPSFELYTFRALHV